MPEQDITVVVALVGAGAALLGTIVGGFFSFLTISKQLRVDTQRQIHSEKISAYSDFWSAYSNLSLTAAWQRKNNPEELADEELSASIRFSSAYAIASLHASTKVRKQMEFVADLALKHAAGGSTPELARQVGALYDVMQEDIADALN